MYKKGYISLEVSFASIMSFYYNKKYGSQMRIRRLINKYFFERVRNEP